ncbi:MAG: prepilin-type N-terminal cleavage/methylation domain-containing protein [Nitrospirae bacterium]|nr:prepilin-type N-terminal cleavage/methylation domain-containing protein [Nitrospirota bacterium]
MREQKGFTLIELAIVLVIIGIIIGAVLKGQDLIESARIKKFDNSLREWETAVWTYVDRKGTFPGDTNSNGIIGDTAASDYSAGEDIVNANFINSPDTNPLTVGSLQFYVFFGNDDDTVDKNVMVICANVDCDQTFDDSYVKYAESFDTVIDGSVGVGGTVACSDGAIAVTASNSGDADEGFIDAAITPAACSTSSEAMVYYFDRGNN